MKLRKLTLHNVRQFADKTAVLGPFGDGLTTITAVNESGKSTFFDALHALFFYEYGSAKKEFRSMQPYSGGAMRIAADIDLNGVGYRIEKVFNLKKAGSSATITQIANGAILKQADDAEHWIKDNILRINNGPFGLLWVRQGTVGVDATAGGVDTRRDAMSSVRGQIDAVTGGRRMDSIVQQCKQEFDAISTKNDKPKAGSDWKDAVDRADIFRAEHDRLSVSVAALSHDLTLKKRVMGRLKELKAPELRQLRQDAITQAAAQLEATKEHARIMHDAQKDIQLLENTAQDLGRDIASIHAAQKARTDISSAIAQAHLDAKDATQKRQQAQQAINDLQSTIAQTEAARRDQSEALKQLRQSERDQIKQLRLAVLSDIKDQLVQPMARLEGAQKVLNGDAVTAADIDRFTDLERRRDIAVETRKVHFSRFTVVADGNLAQIDGVDIPSGVARLIDQTVTVALPGFGQMTLNPADGAGVGIADPAALQAELTGELTASGFETVAAAQQALARHQAAAQDQQVAKTQIRALAPDGIAAIFAEWDTLCDAVDHNKNQPFAAAGTAGSTTASEAVEAKIVDLDDDLARLRGQLQPCQQILTSASNRTTEISVILDRLQADAAGLPMAEDENDTLAKLMQAKSDQDAAIATATAKLGDMQGTGVDLSAAVANHDRAVQADGQDKKEIHLQERELARLDGAIHTQSEGAVEEKLSEVIGKLDRAEARAAQFAQHAQALKLLISHLEAARADAQETYFEPVRNELLPLLGQLHVGADFEIDADKLLIDAITRNGITDKVDALSGGAFEQIAILTRLAFARLFAKQGNHVPIILDDALVHTDDERITTMFNMLAQIAQDQQIIVLSCRTRAFSDLGGERAFITELADPVSP